MAGLLRRAFDQKLTLTTMTTTHWT